MVLVLISPCFHSNRKLYSFAWCVVARFIYCVNYWLENLFSEKKNAHEQSIIFFNPDENLFSALDVGGEIQSSTFECRIYVRNPLLKCHFCMIYSSQNQVWCTRNKKWKVYHHKTLQFLSDSFYFWAEWSEARGWRGKSSSSLPSPPTTRLSDQ